MVVLMAVQVFPWDRRFTIPIELPCSRRVQVVSGRIILLVRNKRSRVSSKDRVGNNHSSQSKYLAITSGSFQRHVLFMRSDHWIYVTEKDTVVLLFT